MPNIKRQIATMTPILFQSLLGVDRALSPAGTTSVSTTTVVLMRRGRTCYARAIRGGLPETPRWARLPARNPPIRLWGRGWAPSPVGLSIHPPWRWGRSCTEDHWICPSWAHPEYSGLIAAGLRVKHHGMSAHNEALNLTSARLKRLTSSSKSEFIGTTGTA